MSPSGLDRIARELAGGEISRRSALKRLAGAGLGLGAVVAPAGVAEAMGGGCPPGRRKCGKKCCPRNARCRNGRCKCKPGFTKCGKKCVDTDTSAQHCGDCDSPCDKGPDDICVDGACRPPAECEIAGDCPTPGNLCEQATCIDGQCGSEPKPGIGAGCLCSEEEQSVIVCDEGTGNLSCDCGGPCVPDCSGSGCGDDGCGGTCSCPAGFTCEGVVCVPVP